MQIEGLSKALGKVRTRVRKDMENKESSSVTRIKTVSRETLSVPHRKL